MCFDAFGCILMQSDAFGRFRIFSEVFGFFYHFCTFSDVFRHVWMFSDSFGYVWMCSDGFGDVPIHLDTFRLRVARSRGPANIDLAEPTFDRIYFTAPLWSVVTFWPKSDWPTWLCLDSNFSSSPWPRQWRQWKPWLPWKQYQIETTTCEQHTLTHDCTSYFRSNPPAPCGPPSREAMFYKFVSWHVCSLWILHFVVSVILSVM